MCVRVIFQRMLFKANQPVFNGKAKNAPEEFTNTKICGRIMIFCKKVHLCSSGTAGTSMEHDIFF